MKAKKLALLIQTWLAAILGSGSLYAADLTWDSDTSTSGAQDGGGTWTSATSNTNWWDGTTNVSWDNVTPANAIFGSGNATSNNPVITVASSTTVNVSNMTFNSGGIGNYLIAAGNSSSRLNFSGTPIITVASGVFATNQVVLSGTSFVKLGGGTFVIKPSNPNVNAGPTVVGDGTLIIGSSTGRLLIPGDLTITNGATARLGADEQIADSAIVTVNGGTYDSGGKTETVGGFILDNNGQVISSSSSKFLTNNGATFDLRSGTVAPNLAGPAGLTKTTSGTVLLSNGGGANTFAGPVLISDGILDLGHSGTGNGLPGVIITITNTGELRLQHDTELNTNATVIVAGATFELLAHNDTAGTVVLDGGGSILNGGNTSKTLTVNTNMDFRNGTCATVLGGPGVMVKSTSGTIVLTMNNGYTGGTLISGGILQLGDGSSTNRGQLGTGPVTNNSVLVLNHSGSFTVANTISGSGSITNLGGSPSFTAANTYNGDTTVSAGTLFVNNTSGSGTGSGAVTVVGGGLGGTGTISGSVSIQSSANLAPGNSTIGTLTINNTLTLAGNTTIEISSGVGQDQVMATTVNYGGTLTVNSIGSTPSPGDTFQIFTASSHTGNFSSISGSPGPNLGYTFDPATGILSVISTGTTGPTLSVSQSGSTLTFSWTDPSFKLQSQTNSLSSGLDNNWFDYPGGGASPVDVTLDPANPSVFFRLSQ
jgi:fibronectin-binding autotransporter adhesin